MEKYGGGRQATDDNIVRCMHSACWITKAADTHCQYVKLFAYPWQQSSGECAPQCYVYTYIACLVFTLHVCYSFHFVAQLRIQQGCYIRNSYKA